MKTNIAAAAAARLTIRHPFWSELFYSMTPNAATKEMGIPTAATDGRTLRINEEWFGKLSLDHQVGVCAHELAHKILLHPYRRGLRDPKMWNYACDYAINVLIRDNGFTLPEPHLYKEEYRGMSAEAIYTELMKNPPPKNQGLDDLMDLRDPENMSPEEIEREENEVKVLVERAMANAKAYGNVPKGIDGCINEAYKLPKESWYNQLHRYMQSLSTASYNWARLNRRALRTHGYFTPLHQDDSLGCVAIFVDTSGSCFVRAQQAHFSSHMNAILAECRPHKVHLYYFDTQVYHGQEICAGELDIQTHPKGGGGTAFEPIFQAIEDDCINPELVIVLTDLEGSFPGVAPDYPVVWASVCDHPAPFGDVVLVE